MSKQIDWAEPEVEPKVSGSMTFGSLTKGTFFRFASAPLPMYEGVFVKFELTVVGAPLFLAASLRDGWSMHVYDDKQVVVVQKPEELK
jgi:hypothetical protein